MLKNILALAGLTLSLSVNAATLVVQGGQLVGATDVDVGGVSYDVQFVDGSCNSLFSGCSNFSFTTFADASVASQALLDEVLIGIYDDDPTLTNGLDSEDSGEIWTPYFRGVGTYLAAVTINDDQPMFDEVVNTGNSFEADYTNVSRRVYAVWTPAEVPVPAAGWLFMSALVGLLGKKRLFRR